MITLLVPGEAEIAIPTRNEYHIIREVLSLNFCFLKNDNIGFENVEHSLQAHGQDSLL